MLIVKITKDSGVTYHGCASVSVVKLDEEGTRRVKMRGSSGVKRICDVPQSVGVEILNDMVIL